MKKILKQKKGITLIALVITIIVLLILAGISISMLAGDNGILQKATDAKTQTGIGQEKEIISLAYNAALAKKVGNGNSSAVTDSELNDELDSSEATASGSPIIVTFIKTGNTYEIDSQGDVKLSTPQSAEIPTLPTASGTKPYFPSNSFSQVVGTDLSTGLVITDAVDTERKSIGNEYVWIEVPNANLGGDTPAFGPDYAAQGLTVAKIEDEPITNDQKTKIETALINYVTTDLLNGSIESSNSNRYNNSRMDWKDEWYDKNGKNASNGGTTTDTEGCGLTETQYTSVYKAMLKSVYNNGGFWIGRYEAGTTEARKSSQDSIEEIIPLSKANLYPINYVTCSKAQTIAGRVQNKGDYSSSLMFGIQWDCVLKYLNKRGSITVADLTSNSSSWGNYYNQQFEINRGKYSQASPWNVYIDYTTATANKVKVEGEVSTKIGTTSSNRILLTTGAVDVNRKQNIYDLAGNVYEWTLEHTSYSGFPYAFRGGFFGRTGSECPASHRFSFAYSVICPNVESRYACFSLLNRSTVV